jgi:hypothetical protein
MDIRRHTSAVPALGVPFERSTVHVAATMRAIRVRRRDDLRVNGVSAID